MKNPFARFSARYVTRENDGIKVTGEPENGQQFATSPGIGHVGYQPDRESAFPQVVSQFDWRENQALARRLKSAKLRHNACIEDIDYRIARGLEKRVIRGLAKDSQWVQNHENIFVLGPTGVGKSYIACALAQKACRFIGAAIQFAGASRPTFSRQQFTNTINWTAF